MNREIIELREVITKLVPLLAGKGLVVTQRGERAYVAADPITKKPIRVNIPNISADATPDFIRAVQGFIDHEVGHVLITDWNYYGGHPSPGPKELQDPKVQRFIGYHNMIEDTMIEPGMARIFPGSRKNISDLRQHFLSKVTKPHVDKAKSDAEKFNFLIIVALRALAGHVEFQEYMDRDGHWSNPLVKEMVDGFKPATLKALPKLTTTKETLEVAKELERILHPAPKLLSVTPNEGSTAGRETVTIIGNHLKRVKSVKFGAGGATFRSIDQNTLEVTTPASAAGVVSITVETQDGVDTLENAFTFITPPPPPPAPPQPEPEDSDEQQDQEPQEGEGEPDDSDGESQDKPDQKAGEGDGDGERDHSEQEKGDEDPEGEPGADDNDDEPGAGSEPDGDDEGDAADEADGDDQSEKDVDDEDTGEDAGGDDEPADEGKADKKPGKEKGEEKGDEPAPGEDEDGAGSDEDEEQGEDGAGDDAGDDIDAEGGDDEPADGDGAEEADEAGDEGEAGDAGADDPDGEADGDVSGDKSKRPKGGESKDEGAGDEPGDDQSAAGEDDADEADASGPGGDEETEEDGDQGANGESQAVRIAIQTDDHDANNAAEAEGDDDAGSGGVGNSVTKSLFDFDDKQFEKADLSSQIAILITNEAVDSMRDDDYNVFTREFDRIEVLKTPAEMDETWVPELEEKTRQMTGRMQKDIERMMASQSRVIKVPGFRSGRLHAPSLHRLTTGDDRVFNRREEHKSKDTAVTLLIDNSGSMGGNKLMTAMSAGYALATTLERVNIKHEVIGFTTGDYPEGFKRVERQKVWDEVQEAARKGVIFHRTDPIMMPIYKTFDERIGSEVKKRMAFMANAQPGLGCNIDGESLEYAAIRLLKRREKRKVILVLSDGQPAGARNCGPHLKETVQKMEQVGIDCIGIGIMDQAVSRFYKNYTVLNSLDQLPTQVMTELKKLLQ